MTRRHTSRITCTALLLAALAPAPALAHAGHDIGQNLMAGLLHPLTGVDHLLMIIAVSAWAALLASAGRLAVAACLAVFVGIGALLPVSGGAALEGAIATTVVGAGILLAVGRRWPLWATALLAAGFALVHGFAHGAEGPARSAAYVSGLVATTAALALIVSYLASLLRRRQVWLRTGGALSAAAGLSALLAN
jgi:urease accessory protein